MFYKAILHLFLASGAVPLIPLLGGERGGGGGGAPPL